MTPQDLKRLRECALKATPGPWTAAVPTRDDDGWATGVLVAATARSKGCRVFAHPKGGCYPNADAAFIAAANPQTVTQLLDLLEEARKEAQLIVDHEGSGIFDPYASARALLQKLAAALGERGAE